MNSEPSGKNEIEYSFDIHSEEEIELDDLGNYITNLIQGKKVVTFGEEHNLNTDNSYSKIIEYKEIIFCIYREMKYGTGFEDLFGNLEYIIPNEERDKLLSFMNFIFSIIQDKYSINHSSSRVFSSFIIPACQKGGFTDIVFEGFNESSPIKSYELSKDKIGFLMIMIFSMLHGLNIHGAYNSTFLFGATGIARDFEEKIDKIMVDNPRAKVITYNGGVHNMTNPIKGEYGIFGATINLEELSFALHLMDKYGNDYLSVDLVDGFGEISNSSHFDFLKGKSTRDKIKIIDHSKGQKSIILPANQMHDFAGAISDILGS